MTKADSVLSTPRKTVSKNNPPVDPTRRHFLTVAAGGAVAAVAITTAAQAAGSPADPIFAAIDAFHRADASCVAVDGDIPNDLGQQRFDTYSVVLRTRPTTPAGLAALTTWAREQVEWLCANGTCLDSEDFGALAATIDDATRGMSGLKPWSPPDSPAVGQHPDTELFAVTDRYLGGLSKYAACALAFGEIEFIEPRPRGYVSKKRAYLRTMKHFGKMERELVNIRPKTLDGLFAKARALEADRCVSEDLRESVLEDVFGMGRGKAVA